MHNDPIIPRVRDAVIPGALREGQIYGPLRGKDRLWLKKVVHYARAINGLAKYLGIKERLEVTRPEDRDATIDFLLLITNKATQ